MSITMINNTQKTFIFVNKAIAMAKDLNMRDRGVMLTLMSFPQSETFRLKVLRRLCRIAEMPSAAAYSDLKKNDILFVYRRGMRKVNSLILKFISILILRKIR